MSIRLTDEQQRIIAHDDGPALVFAVAGSGKTTTMVHRIARVIQDGVFPADKILASSFSRASVADIKRALKPFPGTSRVQVKTLHGLAYTMIKDASKLGLTAPQAIPDTISTVHYAILNRVYSEARARRVSFSRELDALDSEDFFAYVGSCKAELAYAQLQQQALPEHTKAKQATAPKHLPWYLELFQIFEEERSTMGVLTFDDLVPTAWSLLVKHPEFKMAYQQQFEAVMVDEFQDMNLGQVELLDAVVAEHLNYFVVGDDDQCLYSWRGTSEAFILNFDKRYQAKRFIISDNFRCFAEHTVLANHVISRNTKRSPKVLCPARGFGGDTSIEQHQNPQEMGLSIARTVKAAIAAGERPDEIAILVRLFAETSYVEYGLIELGVAYEIIGQVPFYDRPENKLLLKYLQVAQVEVKMQAGETLSAADQLTLGEAWWDVLRTPKRYTSRQQSESILREVLTRSTPPSTALILASGRLAHGAKQGMLSLGSTIAWLAEQLTTDGSAHLLLQALEARLEYKKYLLDNSGFVETGEAKALNVQAFIDYAEGKDSIKAFLAHVEKISFGAAGKDQAARKQARVVITSVFRAKGLQWPRVIIPTVNYGHYPAAGTNTDLSEERRLFYVALTRTQAKLDLHLLSGRPPSIFMEGLHQLLRDTRQAGASLSVDAKDWDAADAINVMKVYRYLERFIVVWHGQDELLTSWLLAADKAWRSVSKGLIPTALLKKLPQQLVDQVKVDACLAHLRGSTRPVQAPELALTVVTQVYEPYTTNDGELAKGTRVRHAMHGEGSVLRFGREGPLSFVEVAFDSRTVRLLLPAARFEVMK